MCKIVDPGLCHFTKCAIPEYLSHMNETVEQKKAILDLEGATCTSCSIAIEHFGRRLAGVSEIFVDRGTSTIQIAYDGNHETIDKIVGLVDRLGYSASTRTTD
jgi:copper chaperone CopZ